MSKKISILLCAAGLASANAAPAGALEAPDVLRGLVQTPVRLTFFSAGAVVGTPIAMVRKTAQNTVESRENLGGKSDNMFAKGGSWLLAPPVGLFTGTLEGAYLGVANSWENSKEKPFSKEMFSLGELKD